MDDGANHRPLLAFALCLVAAAACHPRAADADPRTRLIAVLRDSLGEAAHPEVAFIANGGRPESHLYVTLDTSAVPNLPDSLFDGRARDLARFAVRHYEQANSLDSVTVATRELQQPGAWRVHHRRAFAVAGLDDNGAP